MKSALPNRTLDQVVLDTMDIIKNTLSSASGILPRSALRKPTQHMPFAAALTRMQDEGEIEIINADQSATPHVVKLRASVAAPKLPALTRTSVDTINGILIKARDSDTQVNANMLKETIYDVCIRLLPTSIKKVGDSGTLVAEFPVMATDSETMSYRVVLGTINQPIPVFLNSLETECKNRLGLVDGLVSNLLADILLSMNVELTDGK